MSILGEHLISDQAVALIELVKNAYDADAKMVNVQILHLQDSSDTSIVIEDDGTGMTLQDVTTQWMSPAVDEKQRAKDLGQRTPLGRLPIGEKGVGRFALHQLGHKLEMVTRAASSLELVAAIDWDDYDHSDVYLADVVVRVLEREPVVFESGRTGTRLTILRPRAPWSDKLLKKVQLTLRRLQSPLREAEQGFRVSLRCPERPELENIEPTDILERAHYEFRAVVGADGQCDYEYSCRLPGVPSREVAGREDLVALAGGELSIDGPRCGPFWLNLHVWDRSRDALQASGVPRAELDALCGVSIYRDGLRVLPYGEAGNDWLFLDQERIQAPAERVGNNQLIGLIEVDQETNLSLRDKTNREGLIENDAFLDLRTLTRSAIRVFTSHWRRDRPEPKARSDVLVEASETADEAIRLAHAIESTARDDVEVEVEVEDHRDVQVRGLGGGPDTGVRPPSSVISQRSAVGLLLGELDQVQRGIALRREQVDRLLGLAATGLAAERVVHEFGRQVLAAHDAIRELTSRREPSTESIATLRAVLETLQDEFRVLAPYEGIRRAARLRNASVHELAVIALCLNERALQEASVMTEVLGNDFTIRARATQVLQILDNLVCNAAFWLGTIPNVQGRRMAIVLDPDERSIVVADTGPGMSLDAQMQAFEPFFSMKVDGAGLGLFISSELARHTQAQLRIVGQDDPVRPAWATGAAFELRLANGDRPRDA